MRIPTKASATRRIQPTRFSSRRPSSSFIHARNPATTLQTLVSATAFSSPRRGKIRKPTRMEPMIPPHVFRADRRPTSAPIPLALALARRIPKGKAIPAMMEGTSMIMPINISCWLKRPVPNDSMKLIQTISAGAMMIANVISPLRIIRAPN